MGSVLCLFLGHLQLLTLASRGHEHELQGPPTALDYSLAFPYFRILIRISNPGISSVFSTPNTTAQLKGICTQITVFSPRFGVTPPGSYPRSALTCAGKPFSPAWPQHPAHLFCITVFLSHRILAIQTLSPITHPNQKTHLPHVAFSCCLSSPLSP